MANYTLETPREKRLVNLPKVNLKSEKLARMAEAFARFNGTPQFIVYLTVFVALWLIWNTWAPTSWQFDKASLGYTVLTLMLSLQASYASPLILLAQNRQDDRDRVTAENDRRRAERNLSDTEYLTREIASLRTAMQDVATRDFVRAELRDLLEEIVTESAKAREDIPAQKH
ncbi:MAG: DUF1003 domain-containing protein [Actinomycetaceae bacterium]|nr:DUF1003 domain-containing protein [Actinomycetaceae bacterium]